MLTSKSKWSGGVVIMTISVTIIIALAVAYINSIVTMPDATKIIISSIMTLTLLMCVVNTPLKVVVDGEKIICVMLARRIVIPRTDIVSISKITPETIKGSFRLLGSGGAFGYLGKFRNNRLGRYSMYVTERENMVLVKTKKKKYIFNYTLDSEYLIALLGQGK